MSHYLASSIANVVSLDLDTSWAAQSLQEALRYNTNRTDARFQQKQMQEKEEKLLRLYESQQQRAIERVNRGSAGSTTTSPNLNSTMQGGKVRQMFDERRQKAGIDRSYPLEPLRVTKSNGYNGNNSLDNSNTRIVVKQTVRKDTVQMKNGKPLVNKRETAFSVYNNNNGDESYETDSFTEYPARPILNRTYRRRDLEVMMREHSKNTNLDDEEFPDVNIDEFDEPSPKPKMKNAQILDFNSSLNRISPKTILRNSSGDKSDISLKKETKPLTKKPLLKTVQSPPPPQVYTKNVTPPSPARSVTKQQTTSPMSSKSSNKPAEQRTPSTARPSSKQIAKAPTGVTRDDLSTCKYCNRRFLEDRLGVHEDICAKTLKKKRKAYDATKHRVQGTELEPYTRKMNKPVLQKSSNNPLGNSKSKQQNVQPSKAPPKKNEWRRKHEEFISAIRAAKMAQAHVAKGGKISDLPPPPPSENPDYVQCPHCGRRFNETAAERHIPKCATYEFNKPKGRQMARK